MDGNQANSASVFVAKFKKKKIVIDIKTRTKIYKMWRCHVLAPPIDYDQT